ncbi:nesprin-2-like isoform X2 [Ambystoma mexicanum]
MQTDHFTMVASHEYSPKEGQALIDREGPSQKLLEAVGCNICTASLEKRIKMEYAWQLWAKFVDCFSRYQDWLQGAEAIINLTKSSQVLYADAKEELKKCEVLQRQIQERLAQLESLNRQYRQLAQINGIGLQAILRAMVQECNQRWDSLQKQANAIHKRLKYFVNQREEFEWEREIIEVRLIELDLKLTDVEHFSIGNTLEKIKQLQPLQQDVQLNADRVDGLLVFGEQLIQRSEPLDAECLEEELQVLSCYCQEVFNRVFRFRRRLVSMRLVFEDELQSDKETDQESDSFSDISLGQGDGAEERDSAFCDTVSSDSCKLSANKNHASCRTSSSKSESLDLEWDPSVDVGGSTSHDEDDSFHSAFNGIFPFEEPRARRRARSRRRKGRNLAHTDLPNVSQRSDDIFNAESRTAPSGDGKDLLCCSGLRVTESKEEPQVPRDQEPIMSASCCQTERPTFDPKQIETWLGQTRAETCLKGSQTSEAACCPPFTQEHWFVPMELEINNNVNFCSKQQGALHHMKQPKPAPKARQNPVVKQRRQCSQEVVTTVETRGEVRLPPSFAETPPFKKKSFLVWLRTLALVSVWLTLLFAAGIFVLYVLDSTCSPGNHRAWSRRFTLKYVNGPPPT